MVILRFWRRPSRALDWCQLPLSFLTWSWVVSQAESGMFVCLSAVTEHYLHCSHPALSAVIQPYQKSPSPTRSYPALHAVTQFYLQSPCPTFSHPALPCSPPGENAFKQIQTAVTSALPSVTLPYLQFPQWKCI